MRRLLLLLCCVYSISLFGNGLDISGISFNESTNEISFDITWENSFSTSPATPTTYDGAWVFIKYAPNGGDVWYHANILDSTAIAGINLIISYDDLGVMVFQSAGHAGTFGPYNVTVELAPLLGSFQDFKVFGIEMVYLATGPYYAGDGASPGRFYQNGDVNQPWYVVNELGQTRGSGIGQFDQEGATGGENISALYPKGIESFWTQKYKITARQYIDFLNCLTRPQQENRVQSDITGPNVTNRYVMTNSAIPVGRNPIACDASIGTGPITFHADLNTGNPPNSATDGSNIVLSHMSVNDMLAYFDWSGLRPMSELEYEKICRGEDMLPVPGEHAWGTASFNFAGSILNVGTTTETTSNVGVLSSLFFSQPLRAGYSATATSSRTEASSTFYGVMDMHNMGEFMMGVNSTNFRRVSYGDGMLSPTGDHDVTDWQNFAEYLGNGFSGSNPDAISEGRLILAPTTRSDRRGARGARRLVL